MENSICTTCTHMGEWVDGDTCDGRWALETWRQGCCIWLAADGLLLLQQQREAWGLAQHSAAAALTAS